MIFFIKTICLEAIIKQKPILHKQLLLENIDITETKQKLYGHFQFNSAMKLAIKLNITSMKLSIKIKSYIQEKYFYAFEKINISHPGFINFYIKISFLNEKIQKLLNNIQYIKNTTPLKIIIDYSSPNIAKEMHIGHLRSTIIGDCLANILTYLGHTVSRINHIGDWGTQFGMLLYYLKSICKLKDKEIALFTVKQLSIYYKASQKIFILNPDFKKKAQLEVINLQNEDKFSLKTWKIITNISKKNYNKIYQLLNIKIKTQGESFYKKLLQPIVNKLTKKNLVVISNKAKCIYLHGFKNKNNSPLPSIIQKTNNGFNYTTTDLATLYYRTNYQKANKIIYITDNGQKTHFEMIFKIAQKAKFYNYNAQITHIPIGLMLNDKGKKIKTREGNSVKLIDVINNTILKTKLLIKQKNPNLNIKTLNLNAKILGVNTIKYADLSNNIKQNYKFSYKNTLKYNGNTATFLLYAYARIISIKNHLSNLNINILQSKNKINLIDDTEINIGLHIINFNYIIEKTAKELNPNILTLYLYLLAMKFHAFFQKCNVKNSKYKNSRLLLCNLVEKTMKQGLLLLGLTPLSRI